MKAISIIFLGVAAAITYGIVHDEITIRICLEYFTVFHPFLIDTNSPTVLAAAWGVVATWWVGLPIGILLACAARIGTWPKIDPSQLLPLIARLFLTMAVCALVAGIAGFFLGPVPEFIKSEIAPVQYHRFVADWWTHNASYLSGGVGGLAVCGIVIARRRSMATALSTSSL